MSALLEFHTATGVLRVLSPAGLVLAELGLMEQAQVLNMILGTTLARAAGQPVPGVVVVPYPGTPPPLEVVRAVTNPVSDGDKT